MRYFWDIIFDETQNVQVSINNGTSLETADDPIVVSFATGNRFQFTAEDNQIFLAMTGDVPTFSTDSPRVGLTIKLRSFELNPTPDPVDPDPVDPDPVDPEPVDPEPVDPEPVDPEPTDPEPTDPEPVDPEPVDPEPEPVDPEPVDPEPVEPEPQPQPGKPDLIPDDQEESFDTETIVETIVEYEYVTIRTPITIQEQSVDQERKK